MKNMNKNNLFNKEQYTYCEDCRKYHPNENTTKLNYYGIDVCKGCLNKNYTYCNKCKEYHFEFLMTEIKNPDIQVCVDCLNEYYTKKGDKYVQKQFI